MSVGRFIGIGVGPGDPLLMTIKAVKAIEEADLLVLPAKDKESCRAYMIAKEALNVMSIDQNRRRWEDAIDNKECIFEPFPMSMDKDELFKFHKRVAGRIAKELDLGRNAAFLTIGDPCVYSTVDYLTQILEDMGYNTERVNGVTSFCMAAARLGISLGEGSEEIHVIPGSADIDKALSLPGTKVFMKGGKRLKELRDRLILYEAKTGHRVYGAANCGFPDEKLAYSASEITDDWGYLAVVIVRGDSEQS